MRYRRLSSAGDYVFGGGQGDFYIDQPEAVAQSVMTRLSLWQGDWFADLSQGTPWATQVLGERTRWTRDVVVRNTVDNTEGVADIAEYYSVLNRDTRTFSAAMTIDTIYGRAVLGVGRLPGTVPPLPVAPVVPAPVVPALTLSVEGGLPSKTDVSATPADLMQQGSVYISDFLIRRVDAGRFG